MLKNEKVIVSVITPTWQRHKQLINCIEQVKNQDFKNYFEHIIISDGPDEEVKLICDYYKIQSACIERTLDKGFSKGHAARDHGILMSSGKYIVLWDDDNIYFKNALNTLYNTTKNFDIGICNIHYKLRPPNSSPLHFSRDIKSKDIFCTIPNKWKGYFEISNIDTMNVMIKKSIVKNIKWTSSKEYEGDFYWLKSLYEKKIKLNYNSKYIGIKLF